MADERNTVAPDASTPQTPPSGQGVNAGTSTPNADWQAKLAQLEQRTAAAESRADAAEREAKLASKKADRVREQITNRIAKRMEEKESTLREVGEQEGWDEATLNAKIQTARIGVLTSLKSDELKVLDTDETPTEPTPKFPTQQQVPGIQGQPNPLLQADSLTQHALGLKQFLASIGVSEADLGPQGIIPYVGKPEGSEEQFEFMEKALAVRKKNQELVKQIAQRQQREEFAEEVAAEVEQHGGLGGNGASGGGGSPANNLKHLEKQLLDKYRGTNQIAEYNEELKALRAKHGGRG